MKKKSLLFLLFSLITLFTAFAQDAAYTMTATTKTITSCRSTLDPDLSCTAAGKVVYCNNVDRSYTFVSGSGTVLNANLTLHILDDDFIYVYDGPSSASPLIASWTGGTAANFAVGLNATSTGSVITIRFVSNGTNAQTLNAGFGNYYTGWSILIGCPPSNCNGNTPANDVCVAAPQICNLNGYCGNTSGWYNEDNTALEGQAAPGFGGSIENNSWINFVAGATTATLVVQSANCLFTGSGIQGAVYASTNCSTFTPVSGGNFNQNTSAGTVTLNLAGLTAGNDYFLMIDGYGGNVCDYTVTAIGNVQTLQTTSSASSNTICPNQQFTITATPGATSYSWNPMPISTSSNIAVFNNISSNAVISTTAFGYCGASATVALTMSVVSLPVSATSATVCAGASTVLTASGATSYTWSTGATSPTVSVSPSSPTVYSFTGTTNGCANTNTVSVSVTSNPTVAVSNATTCAGTSVTFTASGATTYSWSTGASTSTISSSTAGVYTVTGTTSGCTNTQTVSLTVTANPTVAVSNATTCAGTAVTFTASGATTYSWSTGALTSTISTSTAGVYTVTGTTNGCSNINTVSLTVTANPTVAVSNATTCAGTPVTITAGGATTYSWSTGATTSTISTATAGVYTVTGTQNGCIDTKTVSLTVVANPTVAVSNATTCSGSPTVITAGGASTYSWSTGALTSTISTSTAGVYTVTGTQNGCLDTKTVSLTVTANPTVAVSNATTCAGTPVTLTAGGASTYSWSTGVTTSTISTSTAGVYTVTGTTNGCTNTNTVSLTVNSIPTATASSTGSLSCTTLTVGLNSSLAGANYTWTAPSGGSVTNANSQNASTSGSGTYTLLVSSAAGCTFSTTTTVTQNTVIPTGVSAGSSATLVCGSPSVALNGSVGTPTNATVLWTGANVCGIATSLSSAACGAGIYTLTATNPLNGCTASSTVQILPSAGSPSVTQNPVTNTITCTNTLVAVSISTTVTPVSYNWSGTGINSTNNGTITVTQGGTFTYTVLNSSNNCETSGSIIVSQNTAVPTTTASTTGTLTCAANTVALTSSLAGMNYTWTAPAGGSVGSANTQSTTASGIGGTYSLNVINPANGCTFNTTTSVSQNTLAPTTVASTNGTLTCLITSVNLNSSTAGMNYTWTAPAGGGVTSANTQSTSASGQGTYSLTIIDPSNGCSFATTTSVTQNTTAPSGLSAGSNQTLTCTSPSVTVIGSITSPTNSPVSWSGINVCGSINSLTTQICAAGIYTLTATDPLNGCSASSTVQISPNAGAPTPSISASALVIDCNNTSQAVTVTATPSTDLTYSWNNTPASTNTNGSVATFTNANTYICTVTNTLNGCSNTAQVVVTTNTLIPSTTASASGTLTCVVSSVNLGVSLAGMNYTWTAPIVGSVGSANTQSTSVTGSGIYTVSIIDPSNGCSFTTTATVSQNTLAPSGVNAGLNQTLTCTTPSVALLGSITSPTNAVISWSGSNVCGSTTSLNTSVCAAGIYTLTATDASNGCVATSTVEVFSNPGAPVLGITSTSLTIDCNNASQSATVTSTPNTNVTYVWNNAPLSTNSNGSEAIFSSPNTYVCTVTNTLSGCSSQIQVLVVTNTIVPVITITPSQTLTCSAPTAVIETTVTPTGTYTYTWTGTGVNGLNTSSVSVTSANVYTVVVLNPINGCTNIATSNIAIDANIPNVTITTTSSNTLISCTSNSVTLTASVSPTDTYTYLWSSGGNSSAEVITTAGIYTVVVTNTLTGCTSTATFQVASNTTAPNITASNTVIPCNSATVALSASSTNTAVTYSWTTSNGTIDSGSNTSSPIVSSAGNYVVTVTNTENGCTSTATVAVSQTTINAAFTANPTSGVAPLDVQFTNQSTGATGYSWTFGDGNTSTNINPSNTFTLAGIYTVTLVATDGACTSSATITIQVDDNSLIIIPNVFTPNGDGSNDVFMIKTIGIKEINCDIFDRWGLKVYTIKSIRDSWDGTNQSDGTYFFILNATGFDGKEYKEQGFITLYR